MPKHAGRDGAGVRTLAGRVTIALMCGVGIVACRDSAERALPDDLSRDLSLAADARTAAPLATVGGDTAASAPTASAPPVGPVAPPAPRPSPDRPAVARQATPAVTEVATSVAATPEPAPASATGIGTAAEEGPAPAPAARRLLLGAGATLAGPIGSRVCSTTNRPGDRLVMRLREPVSGPDGALLPAGTAVLLEVAQADTTVVLRVRSVQVDGELLPLVASATPDAPAVETTTGGGVDKKKVIGGAIAGAIIGQVLGKDTRGTVIGAAGGAAAGAAAGRRAGVRERCLPEGAIVRVVLDQPLFTSPSGP